MEISKRKKTYINRPGFLLNPLFRMVYNKLNSLIGPGNNIWLFTSFLKYSIRNPRQVIKKINLDNFRILSRAIKVENPNQILQNFKRLINSTTNQKEKNFEDTNLTRDNSYYHKTSNNSLAESFSNIRLLSSVHILKILKSKCTKIVITISHDNYHEIVGGVQLYMKKEQDEFAIRSVSYLQFHPHTPGILSSSGEKELININLDGESIGVVTSSDFIALGGLISNSSDFEFFGVVIHHILNWSLNVVNLFLERIKAVEVYFWLHDYYICCPQINLLRNDFEYCYKPDIDSNSCRICRYSELRRTNFQLLRSFFMNNQMKFLTPSKVSKSIIISDYPELANHIQIAPLLNLVRLSYNRINVLSELDDPLHKLKIAFLGRPQRYKGWETWRLFVDSSISDFYYCLYFSSDKANVCEEHIYINALNSPEDSALSLLIKHKVDIVFLWSLLPETYSFAVHEAFAAGCFIITNSRSGNIAAYVQDNSCGIVLESEEELINTLSNPKGLKDLIINYKKGNIDYYELKTNIPTTALIVKENTAL